MVYIFHPLILEYTYLNNQHFNSPEGMDRATRTTNPYAQFNRVCWLDDLFPAHNPIGSRLILRGQRRRREWICAEFAVRGHELTVQ
jgi:hypothetical protein